ncbi:tRNA U34 2-thiouridine synthase MnmA/TrmU [Thermodesulfobium acidiphilum]|uniref:tRNA U34 2-thiouridine synthase MnmA/TrmU n=1 Tax=Thermodesulfobium acidiphilum TaxID=1794699 RepID=A0A2R4W1Z3_THEAF|nr:tRNA 4-thiouridine(8) synthase ThiI [Thermodesulfobium acidiphilum]AWB10736.1 tRNA U34 2-thiouridine synthase MnmA/TrmU [Thermodesulfobium acidiphilum]
MHRAILLFSGGLDSLIAGRIIQDQNIEVIPIKFTTPFFEADERVKVYAREARLKEPIFFDVTDQFFNILKNPKYGFGKSLNPCIDCHKLMIEESIKLLKVFDASFVITGEVLGERPMSQNKRSLNLVAHNYSDLVLRPLSAKLLPETSIERSKIVNRELLEGISGRSRKKQKELARLLNIKKYPAPAGGCVLTEKQFGNKIKKLIDLGMLTADFCRLIKNSRVLFVEKYNNLLITGRCERENQMIQNFAEKFGISYFMPKNEKGSYLLPIKAAFSEEENIFYAKVTASFNDEKDNEVEIITSDHSQSYKVLALEREEINKFLFT